MKRALAGDPILIACLLFAAIDCVFIAFDQWWFTVVPVALLLIWSAIASVQRLMLFIVFATPLSINLEQLELGGIGVARRLERVVRTFPGTLDHRFPSA